MLNMIRMECYRMFHTKSLRVIWIVMAVLVVLTSALSVSEVKQGTAAAQQTEEEVNIGITVEVSNEAGRELTLSDFVFAYMQSKLIALFIVIFAVLYATADLNSGYIKNIGGQVKGRGLLVGAKMAALLLYTVFTIGIFVVVQAVSIKIYYGHVYVGAAGAFFKYVILSTLLHYALAVICMAIAVILRSNVVCMILVVCMCMNMLTIAYNAVDRLMQRAGFHDFCMIKYTVTGKITMLSQYVTGKDVAAVIAISLIGLGTAGIVSGVVFQKRDV